jgi:glycerophosphoryl diester phosphodiesterase
LAVWSESCAVVGAALGDLRRSWRSLALTDLACKLLALVLLEPLAMAALRWLAGGDVVADTDIAWFFLTTRAGIMTLVAGCAIILAIAAVEIACLMAIGLGSATGGQVSALGALAFGAARARDVLGLTTVIVVRLLAGTLPFVLVAGLACWALLRPHDISYYLAQRPPAFWAAAAIAAVLGAALAAWLAWTIARWALALPLVLFESVRPRRALGESARRSIGSRWLIISALALWGIAALALLSAAAFLPEIIGRILAPRLSGSLALLLVLVTGLVLLWTGLGLVVGVLNTALFALIIVRLSLRIGDLRPLRAAQASGSGLPAKSFRITRPVAAATVVLAIFAALGFALPALRATRRNQPVAVIAHRGSSATAPENTLAAFRLAAEQGADFVELDVQESADGEVLVVHDSDFMRVGGAALKVWDVNAAEIRTIDVGSHAGSRFAAERVPTLAEALAACKGRVRVIVELKSYGHAQRLEEAVAEIVEASGMESDCVFMSLDHDMVRNMKQLRPSWRCGVLAAKALGDLTALGADFLAVEARVATGSFVRRAHGAGQEVYVWTVNDPAWMLSALSD